MRPAFLIGKTFVEHGMLSNWAEQGRWEWFASGDPQVAPRVVPSPAHNNSAQRLLFEAGLLFLVPLALATVLQIVLGP
jgi:hypothetical protein